MRTNFSMPDVLSIALGGGTRVKVDSDTVRTHTHTHMHIIFYVHKVFPSSFKQVWCM